MKRFTLFFFMICVSIWSYGQNTPDWYIQQWSKVDSLEKEGKPTSALKLVKEIDLKAKKQEEYQERLMAWEKMVELQGKISWKQVRPLIDSLMGLENEFTLPQQQSNSLSQHSSQTVKHPQLCYNLLMAKLLQENSNYLSGKIRDDFRQSSITTWNENEFNLRIEEYIKAAMSFLPQLQNDYNQSQTHVNLSQDQCDAALKIMIQALDILERGNRGEYYQELAKELIKQSQNNADINIKAHIDYFYFYKLKDEQKIKILDSLIVKHQPDDAVVKALAEKIRIQANQYTEKHKQDYFQKLSDECDHILESYPNSEYLQKIKDLQESFNRRSGSIRYKNQFYPGEDSELEISYTNIKKLRVDVYPKGDTLNPIWTKDLSLKAPLNINKSTTIKINIPKIGDYVLACKDLDEGPSQEGEVGILAQENIAVSRIGFVIRNSTNKGIQQIYAADFFTGKPFAKVQVEATKYNSKTNWTDNIELDGFTPFFKSGLRTHEPFLIKVNVGDDTYSLPKITYLVSEFKTEEVPTPAVHLITDRKRYRPGEQVKFKAIAYQRGENAKLIEKGLKLQAEFTNPRNKVIEETAIIITDEWGSFDSSFIVPEDASGGYYNIKVKNESSRLAQIWINVDDYALPYFELSLNPEKADYAVGDTISIKGNINSLTGQQLQGTEVRYEVKSRPQYSFGEGELLKEGVVAVGENSEFEIEFVSIKGELSFYKYSVEVTAVAPNGESHKAEETIFVYAKPYVIEAYKLPSEICKEENKPIELELRSWSTKEAARGIKGTYYITKPSKPTNSTKPTKHARLLSGTFTSSQPLNIDWSKLPSGTYEAVFTSPYADTTTKHITVFSKKDKNIPIKKTAFFYSLSSEVAPGKPIEFLFGTNAKRMYATLQIYDKQDNVIYKENIVADKGMKLYAIPYKDTYPEDLKLLLVSIYQGEVYTYNASYKRVKKEKELKMTFISLRDKREPGTKEQFSVEVKDSEGKPQRANIVLTAYNKASDYPFNYTYSKLYLGTLDWYGAYISDSPSFQNNFLRLDVYDRVAIPFALGNELALKEFSSDQIRIRGYSAASEDTPADTPADTPTEIPAETHQNERKDFSISAAFLPNLLTDENGIAKVEFTYPDALATYKIMAMAVTKDASSVVAKEEVLVTKDLMISAYLPQFLRQGDVVQIKALASNLTDEPIEATLNISASEELKEGLNSTKLRIAANSSQVVTFTVNASGASDSFNLRLELSSENHKDIELTQIPIIPAVGLYTRSEVVYGKKGEKDFDIKNYAPKHLGTNEKFEVLTYSPQELLLQTLPSLLESNDTRSLMSLMDNWYLLHQGSILVNFSKQLMDQWADDIQNDKPQFTPSEEALRETPWRFDSPQSRYDLLKKWQSSEYVIDQIASYIEKCKALQNNDGGFSWMPGMPSSAYVTLYYLDRMSQIDPMKISRRAVDYLDRYMYKQMEEELKADSTKQKELLTSEQLDYLRLRSATLKHFAQDANDLKVWDYYLSKAEGSWQKYPIQGKVMIATALNNIDKDVRHIMSSILEYAEIARNGSIHFPNAVMPYRGLINSEVKAHLQLLCLSRSLPETDATLNEGLALWLMLQRRNQTWEQKGIAIDATVELWQHYTTLPFTPAKYFTEVLYSCELPLNQIEASGNGFEIERKLYRVSATGEELITEQTTLEVGDEVVVRYHIKNSDNRSFLHLKSLRTGAMKPIKNVSGYSWRYYKEIMSNETNYYFYTLPEGDNFIEERFFVEYAGTFSDAYSRIKSVLAPLYFANSSAEELTVSPK